MEKEKIEELEKEIVFLKTTIDYMLMLESRKNVHLGRPRLSDMKCQFCVGYSALNNGAYGEKLTQEMLNQARINLTNNK